MYFLASVGALIVSYAEAFGSGKLDLLGHAAWILAAPLWLPWGPAGYVAEAAPNGDEQRRHGRKPRLDQQ